MIVRYVPVIAGLLGLSLASASAQTPPATPTPPASPAATGNCFEDLIGEGQSSLSMSVQYPEARIVTVRAWATVVAGSTLKISFGGAACGQAQTVNNAYPLKLSATCVRVSKANEAAAIAVELTPPQDGMVNAHVSCGR